MILGYWAAGRTVYRNKIMIGTFQNIFFRKLLVGFFFGFILIPMAIIGAIRGK